MLNAWDFVSTNSPENISQQNHSSFTENADQMLKRKYSVNTSKRIRSVYKTIITLPFVLYSKRPVMESQRNIAISLYEGIRLKLWSVKFKSANPVS